MKSIFTLLLLGFAICAYSQDYFPLEVGNKWVWKSFPSKNEAPGEITLEILRDSTVADTTFYIYHQSCLKNDSDCGSFDDVFFITESDPSAINVFEEGGTFEIYQRSFQDGDSTTIFGEKVKAEYIGDFTVTAGTFASCYKAGIDIYAPNVGLIASCWDDNCKEPYQQELLEYNIVNQTSIKDLNSDYNVHVFPNPTKDFIRINYIDQAKMKSIKIFNMQGSVIYKTTDKLKNLDLSGFSNGLYILQFDYYDKNRQIFKILKQ